MKTSIVFQAVALVPFTMWLGANTRAEVTTSFIHEFEVTDSIWGRLDGKSYSHELLTAGRDKWEVVFGARDVTAQKAIQWRMINAIQYRAGQLYDLTPEDSNLAPGVSNLPAKVGKQKTSTFDHRMQLRTPAETYQGILPDYPGEIGLSFWSLPPTPEATEWLTTCRPGFRGLDREITLQWKIDSASNNSDGTRRLRFNQPTAEEDFKVAGFVDVKDGWIVNARYVAEFKIPPGFGFRGEGTMKSVGRSRWISPEDAVIGKSDTVRMFERRKQYEVEVRQMYYRLLANKIYPTNPSEAKADRQSALELSTTIRKYADSVSSNLPDEKESVASLVSLSDRVLEHLKEL